MTILNGKRLVVDIETNMSHGRIWMACTYDIDTEEAHTWKEANKFLDYTKDATLIIGHNYIGFDGPLLKTLWGMPITLKKTTDTLILSRLLEPSREKGHSLESWGESLGEKKSDYKAQWEASVGRPEAYKGECFDAPVIEIMEAYCLQDVKVTAKLFHFLTSSLKEKKFSEECQALEHYVAFIIAEQERNGFKLDVTNATMLLNNIKREMDSVYEQMQQRWPSYEVERVSEKTGKPLKPARVVFNPGSRKQIGEKLQELGWKPEKFTETGQPVVDEVVLAKVSIPEAQTIARYLLLQKRVAQIESWLQAVGKDGRVHGRVITNGTVTGRMSHSSPNMAQIPNSGSVYGPECRECWVAEDGWVLVGCDASGLELRMLAHYMQDEEYVKAVTQGSSKDGTDVHTKNQKAAGLQTRDQAKTFIYAFLYGAGPGKIGSIIGAGAKEGQKLIDRFLKSTPALSRLRAKVATYATKGFVPGLDGRKIWVRSEHSALNSLLQGAGSICMKQALCIFYDKVSQNNWPVRFVANVHDEIQLETKTEYVTIVGEAARQSIIEAGEHFKLRCPLDGEYKHGKSWRDTH